MIGLPADAADADAADADADAPLAPEAVVLIELLHALTASAAAATTAPIQDHDGTLLLMGHFLYYGGDAGAGGAWPARQWCLER